MIYITDQLQSRIYSYDAGTFELKNWFGERGRHGDLRFQSITKITSSDQFLIILDSAKNFELKIVDPRDETQSPVLVNRLAVTKTSLSTNISSMFWRDETLFLYDKSDHTIGSVIDLENKVGGVVWYWVLGLKKVESMFRVLCFSESDIVFGVNENRKQHFRYDYQACVGGSDVQCPEINKIT